MLYFIKHFFCIIEIMIWCLSFKLVNVANYDCYSWNKLNFVMIYYPFHMVVCNIVELELLILCLGFFFFYVRHWEFPMFFLSCTILAGLGYEVLLAIHWVGEYCLILYSPKHSCNTGFSLIELILEVTWTWTLFFKVLIIGPTLKYL